MTDLGKLMKVELRDIWKTEDRDFTPWLAQERNMEVLAETLGLSLEVEAQERNVGPFRADILCKDLDDNSWVLIENQLERTDHTHLGQLLTYASGLTAVTIIWVAARFSDEHRKALDWLNEITDERLQFFGLEVELWRIGESPAAPKFNVVSKPNQWSKAVGRASKSLESGALTETKQAQLAYWEALHLRLQDHSTLRSRKPRPQHWTTYSIGRSGMHLVAKVNSREDIIAVELELMDDNALAFFNLLKDDRGAIEQELAATLDWLELPSKQTSRIALSKANSDFADQEKWDEQHSWIVQNLERFHKTFALRAKTLDPDDFDPEAHNSGIHLTMQSSLKG
jgi:hypothetical protein